MKTRHLLLYMVTFFLMTPAMAQHNAKIIAHRGYWKCEGSAQNSLTSITKAAEIKVYGAEFDVQLTADNVLVVYHDSYIDGINIKKSTYAQIKDKKLPNGETLPTLDQFLDHAKKYKRLELIFELKPHANAERDREAAQASVAMVNAKKLRKRVTYISFSLEAVKELHRLSPKTPVYYLNGELSPKEIKALGLAGMDYQYKVMLKHPEWFKEAKELNLKTNVWTIRDVKTAQKLNDMGVDFMTTDIPVEVMGKVNK